jgi:putative colanic acid biosynthesis acetyltransferase WcaF
MKIHKQISRHHSPWSINTKNKMLLWEYVWVMFCRWTPKQFNKWRLFWLKLFGTKINGTPFVHQRCRIEHPWNLILHDRSCLGDSAVAYAQDVIELFENAVIAQETYICTGTHDFENPIMPLKTDRITIKKNAFIGARTFLLPGITIGENTIIGACSVVSKSIPNNCTAVGNPCKVISNKKVM